MVCKSKRSYLKGILLPVLLTILFLGCVALLFLNPLRSEKWTAIGITGASHHDEKELKEDAAIAFGVVPCQDNSSCEKDQFCNLDVSSTGYSHEKRPQKGYCRSNQAKTASNGWLLSVFYMDFWSVDLFCSSHGLKRVTLPDLGCDSDKLHSGKCQSEILRDLHRQLKAYYVWTNVQKDDQYGHNIDLSSGIVNFDFMDNAGHALCH